MAKPGCKPMISRLEVNHANQYSNGPLLENLQIYLSNIHCDETKSESWPVQIFMSVKLELTDFNWLVSYLETLKSYVVKSMHSRHDDKFQYAILSRPKNKQSKNNDQKVHNY